MAGSKSNYLENEVLDSILGKSSTELSTGAGGVAGTLYIMLFESTVTVDDSFTTTSSGECPGSTYARVAVTNSSNNWANTTGGTKINKAEFEFTTAAGSDWGTVGTFAIADSNSTSAGNIYYWGDLTSNQTISSGNVVKFSTGSITVTED
jgi:hypothetical protein